MSGVIPPSSAPIVHDPPSHSAGGSDDEEVGETLPITDGGQICFERVLPSQAHYYKVPSPPKTTGKVILLVCVKYYCCSDTMGNKMVLA